MKRASTPTIPSPASSERGRPREFDIDHVTRAAGRVFWEQGYHATSIETLCKSTGLFRASLYGVFGDKHGLLIAAFDQYAEGAVARLRQRLEDGASPHEALRQALLHYTKVSARLSGRHGCFITNAAVELLPADEALRPHIETTLRRIATYLAAAVIRGQQAGEFNAALDEQAVSTFLLCVIQGFRVLGKVSFEERDLVPVVEMTMRALI
ncbi:TetR/AcrR family transcriptional regulator [Caballeronia sp. SEWSISQ10-4 2]|uniref:TetR/AcrR family transcriptional regulator n=1 Tax=Caballeronia sp. SEWSISQ10-4 2 TaxID=2937438 RepID=UPI002655DB43|nr:TetR/AcrR family transcriptional regulator [Caballeronia sp. SEWSISQ10-4 2]MDN7183127.1 TetR/AcrR family transcriptional regulator [Caballeronia sp. SEWSISQ10-4 2]